MLTHCDRICCGFQWVFSPRARLKALLPLFAAHLTAHRQPILGYACQFKPARSASVYTTSKYMLKCVNFALLYRCEMFTDFDNVCDIGNIWIWVVTLRNPKLIYPSVSHRTSCYMVYTYVFLHIGGMYTKSLI
jgi:hypothetical protein